MARKSNYIENADNNLIENIIEVPLEQVISDAMLPYSEYVILERAIPRIEDGLKPVQRRILYTMNELGILPTGEYKKCARIVGDCMGKYHPHGDQSVYDAMVCLAQDFKMRACLVDGQGNFGSVDGDPPAAMRYTEAKLQNLAMELLRDFDKNTVSMDKNFDDSLEEPHVLPGRFPNLLVNGAEGIAIGIATKIPCHNMTEAIDGCIAYIDNPKISLDEMLTIIKGPDFSTGGFIVSGESMREMYETGRGKFIMRAKVDIENDGATQSIIISQIPYGVDKGQLLSALYKLKEPAEGTKIVKVEQIYDVVDESDKTGMRMVVRLRKGEDALKVLPLLFKYTSLQANYNGNMVAIVGGKPEQLSLLRIISCYVEHQRNIIYKRTQYDLNIAKKRDHILSGYMAVIPCIDEVIAIIRNSSSRGDAKAKIKERFDLSDAQADAILSLQLGNINRLDVTKFEKEARELQQKIVEFTKVISSSKEQFNIVKKEMTEIRDKYRQKRLTTIVRSLEDLEIKPFDPTKRTAKRGALAIDTNGNVKFLNSSSFLMVQRDIENSTLDGITTGLAMLEPDDNVLIISSLGNAFKIDTQEMTELRWTDKGIPLSKLFSADECEKAVDIIKYKDGDTKGTVFAYTKNGLVVNIRFSELLVNKSTFSVFGVRDGDEIIGSEREVLNAGIFFVTSDGNGLFTEKGEYSIQGRKSTGTKGIELNDGAYVVMAKQLRKKEIIENGQTINAPEHEIVVISDSGLGKRVSASEFEEGKRAKKGNRIIELNENTIVLFATAIKADTTLAVINDENELSVLETYAVRLENRTTKGRALNRTFKFTKVFNHAEDVQDINT